MCAAHTLQALFRHSASARLVQEPRERDNEDDDDDEGMQAAAAAVGGPLHTRTVDPTASLLLRIGCRRRAHMDIEMGCNFIEVSHVDAHSCACHFGVPSTCYKICTNNKKHL
jgi:hypothetical protein